MSESMEAALETLATDLERIVDARARGQIGRWDLCQKLKLLAAQCRESARPSAGQQDVPGRNPTEGGTPAGEDPWAIRLMTQGPSGDPKAKPAEGRCYLCGGAFRYLDLAAGLARAGAGDYEWSFSDRPVCAECLASDQDTLGERLLQYARALVARGEQMRRQATKLMEHAELLRSLDVSHLERPDVAAPIPF